MLTNFFVNSGINAPATVPQLMIIGQHTPEILTDALVHPIHGKITEQHLAGNEGDDDGHRRR